MIPIFPPLHHIQTQSNCNQKNQRNQHDFPTQHLYGFYSLSPHSLSKAQPLSSCEVTHLFIIHQLNIRWSRPTPQQDSVIVVVMDVSEPSMSYGVGMLLIERGVIFMNQFPNSRLIFIPDFPICKKLLSMLIVEFSFVVGIELHSILWMLFSEHFPNIFSSIRLSFRL